MVFVPIKHTHTLNYLYTNIIYGLVFRVPTPPPNGMGPQVAPPAVLFASYLQHFSGPASTFTRYLLLFRPYITHTYSLKVPMYYLLLPYIPYLHIPTIPTYTYHTYHTYHTFHTAHTYHTFHTFHTYPYIPYIPDLTYIPYIPYISYQL